jgi:hypothetical protein
MSALPAPASGHIPGGWTPDTDAPTHYVVRCTTCGRLEIKADLAKAHSTADGHALRCGSVGVTPVTRPATDDDEEAVEESAHAGRSTAAILDVPLADELVGHELAVEYDSVSSQSGAKRVHGTVHAVTPAPDAADADLEAIIIQLPTESRRRLDLRDDVVECQHNSASGWRKIGDLDRLTPAHSTDQPVVMTDGGTQVVDESEPADHADDPDQADDTDDEAESQPDTLTTAIEAGTLEQTVDILLSVDHECIFNLGRDGLEVRLVGPANVYLADLQLSSEAFGRVGDGRFAIGVNLERFENILDKADSDDIVELVLDTETRKLHVEFSNVEMDFAGIHADTIRAEPDPFRLRPAERIRVRGDAPPAGSRHLFDGLRPGVTPRRPAGRVHPSDRRGRHR